MNTENQTSKAEKLPPQNEEQTSHIEEQTSKAEKSPSQNEEQTSETENSTSHIKEQTSQIKKPTKVEITTAIKYLGYDKMPTDDRLLSLFSDSATIIETVSKPRFLYSYFDISKTSDGISLQNTPVILKGSSISNHLEGCDRVAIFCVTLSNAIDTSISKAKFDVLKQLILDTFASCFVEQYCEYIEDLIINENTATFHTKRFGIGYGDLSLTYQNDILTLLNAQKKIGVLATNSGILTPRKSVTAIIGFSKNKTNTEYNSCDSCLLRGDCTAFRKGEHCGK
ncbi:MAG: vitamin B12 dependent-methionine synthase activation domain-containing protein [Clostridia bacterium]